MTGKPTTDDAIVLFEVLSKSNTRTDQDWRKRVYASVPNCQHYITISMQTAEVMRYDRTLNWNGMTFKGLKAKLVLPVLKVEISLVDIYRWTPIK